MMKIVLPGAVVALIGIAAPSSAATIFNFQFDNAGLFVEPDGVIGLPVVGTGTFISPFNLTAGTYALSSLAGYSMSFMLGPNVFVTSDEATSASDVAVRIKPTNSGESLEFTENGMNGDSGPHGGSLDLIASSGKFLSFEPSTYGGNYLYILGGTYFGNYLALSAVPEPATWTMLLTGFGLVGAITRRRFVTAVSRAGFAGGSNS